MMLIADSGSTKTHWCVIEDNERWDIYTSGINPFYQNATEISTTLTRELLPQLPAGHIASLFFYGAGCVGYPQYESIREAVTRVIDIGRIEVGSDLLGAARALCGTHSGIACILGTGANSCYYNGDKIEKNISPLGFILGDEGSGAYLGKKLLSDIFKEKLSREIIDLFFATYSISLQEVLQAVYRDAFPNRYLAAFTRFIYAHKEHPEINRLLVEGFISFFTRNVFHYDYKEHPIHCTGSIAYYFKDELTEAAKQCELQIEKIEKEPIDGLITFHMYNKK